MAAGEYNITIEAGATFSAPLRWTDEDGDLIDTSGYTARMQVRNWVSDASTICSLDDDDGITLGIVGSGATAYNIKLDLSAAETAALDPLHRGFIAHYDLELTDAGGVVTRLLEGAFVVSPVVTR